MTSTDATRPGMSRFRWVVCALLFFATTIGYVDRQVLSMLAKTLETKIGWDSIQYGYITSSFQIAYAVGLLGAGWFIDRLGTRKGFAVAMGVWSIAAMVHALAFSAFSFGIARALLGLGEAANFPACIKTVAEWFPKKERALATGIFNSGANIGNMAAALVVPWLALAFGWQSAFIATGAVGFVWLVSWLTLYSRPQGHPRVSNQELAHIQSDPPDKVEQIAWARVFPKRETWAFGLGKFLTDPVWWFYMFWLPKYLQETFGLTLPQVVLPTVVVYNASCLGSVGAGWLSGMFMGRGWSVNAARKSAMLLCALAVVPVLYAPYSKSLWIVVGLVSLAAAAHQGWSANLYTIVSDMFPRSAVGSVVGIGGTAGAVGGALMQIGAGYVVELTHSYVPLFLISSMAYVLALGVIHALAPKLDPARLD